jgi:hypothetical protein
MLFSIMTKHPKMKAATSPAVWGRVGHRERWIGQRASTRRMCGLDDGAGWDSTSNRVLAFLVAPKHLGRLRAHSQDKC